MKGLCTSAPIMAFADFTKPFQAAYQMSSTIGLDAVLYQKQDGEDRLIVYASRTLSKSESHYPST